MQIQLPSYTINECWFEGEKITQKCKKLPILVLNAKILPYRQKYPRDSSNWMLKTTGNVILIINAYIII